MYRIGVLGLDGHQGTVLEGITKREDAALVAVSSERPEAIEAVRKHAAVGSDTTFHADWHDLLDAGGLDIVVICSMNSLHAPMIKAAAERKLHIISEKPLTTSLDELADVRRAVESAGVRLTMLLTMRFTPPFLAVHETVRTGRIGTPILATAFKSYRLGDRPLWQRQHATYGGTIPFVNIHSADLLRWTTGCEFVECQAYHGNAGTTAAGEMEDHAVVIFRMDNGGAAVSQQDFLRPASADTHGQTYLRIVGSDGLIEVVHNEKEVVLTTATEPIRTLDLPAGRDFLSDFLDSLDGKHDPLLSQADCFRMTEICLKARDAADSGQAVRLDEAE